MSDEVCRFEPNVLRAVRFDEWTEALRRHVPACEECTAAMTVGPWMRSFAAAPDIDRVLPNPSILWIKAQILQRDAAVERVATPLNSMQIAAYLLVGACWAALLTWKWKTLQAWFTSFTPSSLVTGAAAGSSLSLSFMILCVGLASVTVMLAMHTILAEE
jgi:hypothetical protein